MPPYGISIPRLALPPEIRHGVNCGRYAVYAMGWRGAKSVGERKNGMIKGIAVFLLLAAVPITGTAAPNWLRRMRGQHRRRGDHCAPGMVRPACRGSSG